MTTPKNPDPATITTNTSVRLYRAHELYLFNTQVSFVPEYWISIFPLDPINLANKGRYQQNTTHPFYVAHTTMAESATPTFKLVLVGDGGTGKVTRSPKLASREEY